MSFNSVVGALFPIAAGVAISPIPISAVILLLLSPRGSGNGIGFLLGWIAGVFGPTVGLAYAVTALQSSGFEGINSTVKGAVLLLLGLACLLLAWRQWRSRPRRGQNPRIPGWLAALERSTPPRSLGLGFALSALNPEDLLLSVSAGIIIGTELFTDAAMLGATAIFTVVSSLSVAAPVVWYLVARRHIEDTLQHARAWLQRNNAVVMAVLLIVIGFTLVGHGIASF